MTRPVVVQHVAGVLHEGGPQMALSRLLASPLAERFDFRVVVQHSAAGGVDVALLRRLAAEIRTHRPALVHVRGLGNEGFHGALAARLAGAPRVLVSVHGTQRDIDAVASPLRRTAVVKVLEPATLRFADAVTTVCAATARRPFLDPARAKLLPPFPNGVPLPDLSRRSQVRADVRRELGIEEGEVVVLSAARLVQDKGLGDLARAACLLRGSVPPWRLLVAGSGQDEGLLRDSFTAAAPDLPVQWLGTRPDVDRLMLAADVFVLPSWQENLSNALLEAMATALPVVATTVGGSPEAVADAGVLVPRRDPSALAKGIGQLLRDAKERQRLGVAARARVAEHFTVDVMARRIGEIYDTMLARTPRRVR